VSAASSDSADELELPEAVGAAERSASSANSAKDYPENSVFADGLNSLESLARRPAGIPGEQEAKARGGGALREVFQAPDFATESSDFPANSLKVDGVKSAEDSASVAV
jgi:hypothetical protein